MYLKKSTPKSKLEWDLTPFYEEMTNTALQSYSKHVANQSRKIVQFEDSRNPNNFFSNFPEFLKEFFGLEKKKEISYAINEEMGDINRKIELLNQDALEPFLRKPKLIEKNHLHMVCNKFIPDFEQVHQIMLNSEIDIMENESILL